MKKYIDAELQIVRMSNNDIVTVSGLGVSGSATSGATYNDAADRFRDFEDYGF